MIDRGSHAHSYFFWSMLEGGAWLTSTPSWMEGVPRPADQLLQILPDANERSLLEAHRSALALLASYGLPAKRIRPDDFIPELDRWRRRNYQHVLRKFPLRPYLLVWLLISHWSPHKKPLFRQRGIDRKLRKLAAMRASPSFT